jgi:hypothetical protein
MAFLGAVTIDSEVAAPALAALDLVHASANVWQGKTSATITDL